MFFFVLSVRRAIFAVISNQVNLDSLDAIDSIGGNVLINTAIGQNL